MQKRRPLKTLVVTCVVAVAYTGLVVLQRRQQLRQDTETVHMAGLPVLPVVVDMSQLKQQRFKPWFDVRPLDGDTCARSDTPAAVCPEFSPCLSSVLHDVAFCRHTFQNDSTNIFAVSRYEGPLDVTHGRWREVPMVPSRLPYDSAVLRLGGGVWMDWTGRAFNDDVHFLLGGCQDVPDDGHGGARIYSVAPNASFVTPDNYHPSSNPHWPHDRRAHATRVDVQNVLVLDDAISLAHVFSPNSFHLLIDLLPRLLLYRDIIHSHPGIPILLTRPIPSHLLVYFELVGLDTDALNLVYINDHRVLTWVRRALFASLNPRCLHSDAAVWKKLRDEWSRGIALPGFNSLWYYRPSITSFDRITMVWISRKHVTRRHLIDEDILIETLALNLNLTRNSASTYSTDALPSNLTSGHIVPMSLYILSGFEPIHEQLPILSTATILAGPHGAGLANLIFTPADSTLIELMPVGYWNPCYLYLYQSLSSTPSHGHYVIATKARPLDVMEKSGNIIVDKNSPMVLEEGVWGRPWPILNKEIPETSKESEELKKQERRLRMEQMGHMDEGNEGRNENEMIPWRLKEVVALIRHRIVLAVGKMKK